MDRPSDSLKFFADQLARQLSTDDGARLAQLLRLLSTDPPGPAPAPGASAGPPDVQRVGIWQRTGGDEPFVRDQERRLEWPMWANAGEIPAKAGGRRVLLLGESVARGFLYDPAYNPAGVLAALLESRLGPGEVEVVDLARTSQGREIKDLALAAAVLEPDAVVLFCGNNWRYELPTEPLERGVLAAAVRERGPAGYREHAEEFVRRTSEEIVDEVSAFYAERGVPVLWIAPEFNLADWRDPVANAAHLPDDGNPRWAALYGTARAALAEGRFEEAAEAARRMVELDQGTNAAGHYVLADCARAAGDEDAARAALEAARDAQIWDTTVVYAPRSTAPVLAALREGAERHGGLLVDSPELFREHLGGGIPDRRLFIDYCHLNAEGIRVTMAAAAAALLGAFKETAVSWRELLAEAPGPEAGAEAETLFLAAVHNAHWWQDGELVEHSIERSVGLSDRLAPLMSAYLELQARRTPMLMCESAERLLKAGSPQIQRYLFVNVRQYLDPLITGSIANVLAKYGQDVRRQVEKVWIDEHSVGLRKADLLDPSYNSAGRQALELQWSTPGAPAYERNYYKAFSARSVFFFVGEAGRPVELDATWRTPHPAGAGGQVSVEVNGRPVATASGGAGWERHGISLPGEIVCDGLNEVVLAWPSPAFPGDAGIRRFSADVLAGRTPDPYCSFGDVHTFTAVAGGAGDSDRPGAGR
ncbi:hypothetical protein [Kitasatospora sp. NBC_00039]|uniref:hypothetical protein n=1 Tax=Kitasatospora sp. NBC_00039 TaxID=2903565 RepID=UPI0032431389